LDQYFGISLYDTLSVEEKDQLLTEQRLVSARPVIEKVEALTPELLRVLKESPVELNDLRWDVFEHLVAELLAQQGFEDVRLVGRDSQTGADIFAAKHVGGVNTELRFFVEVKHRKGAAGIEVIDQVIGAIVSERERFGWHAGLIVSSGGFKNFKRATRPQISLKGVELRDRDDLFQWLADYHPNCGGLWLPSPTRSISEESH